MGFFDKFTNILGDVSGVLDDVGKIKNVLDPPSSPKLNLQQNNNQSGPPVFEPIFKPGDVFQFPGLPPFEFPELELEPEPSFFDEPMNVLVTALAVGALVFAVTR